MLQPFKQYILHKLLVTGYAFYHQVKILSGYHQHFAGLNAFNRKLAWLTRAETLYGRNALILKKELEGNIPAIVIKPKP